MLHMFLICVCVGHAYHTNCQQWGKEAGFPAPLLIFVAVSLNWRWMNFDEARKRGVLESDALFGKELKTSGDRPKRHHKVPQAGGQQIRASAEKHEQNAYG